MIINGFNFVCCISFLKNKLLCFIASLTRKASFAREKYDTAVFLWNKEYFYMISKFLLNAFNMRVGEENVSNNSGLYSFIQRNIGDWSYSHVSCPKYKVKSDAVFPWALFGL